MLGFAGASRFHPPIPQVPSPPLATARRNLAFPSSLFRAPVSTHENPSRFAVFAGDGDVRNQEPGSVEWRANGPDGGAGAKAKPAPAAAASEMAGGACTCSL
ncbi:hypothetical protein NL676_033526 [Syzygium grande]|nr:hypothetical protein NL676_033526 [Syzygium grande]